MTGVQTCALPISDGFNSKFYKLHWEKLNELIVTSMQQTFESGKIINEINHSVISLIPKVKTPKDMSDYRPISCCNTIYKILSKILCNRMKLVINDLISENQFAFLPSRNIHDGIMLAHESIKDFNKKGVRKMCIKIDLKKAYDTINRNFILHKLRCMDFPLKWINLLTNLIQSPSFSVNYLSNVYGFF